MNRTKIDWCRNDDGTAGYTWNPVTGCLHNCEYCYARRIAKRFEWRKGNMLCTGDGAFSPICFPQIENGICDMKYPLFFTKDCGASKTAIATFPYGFTPTFHRYRLDQPQHIKKPSTIFVGSICDLFGNWVPLEWIQKVFETCDKAPWHRYIFLTKNPGRLDLLQYENKLPIRPNFWFGTSAVGKHDEPEPVFFSRQLHNAFISCEPLLSPISEFSLAYSAIFNKCVKWVVIGAETGNRKNKVIPKREWIADILSCCRNADILVFMKNSLSEIWKEPLEQEFPWLKVNGDQK